MSTAPSSPHGSGESSSSCRDSRWTDYFEYFAASEVEKTGSHFSTFGGSGESSGGLSLVSDAASGAVAGRSLPPAGVPGAAPEGCKKLGRRRMREGDDSLEDTASSPVRSPKVCNNLTEMNADSKGKLETASFISQDKNIELQGNRSAMKLRPSDFSEEAKRCEELKKKGLCLVPVSMIIDYLNH